MKYPIAALCTLALTLAVARPGQAQTALVNGCYWDPNGVPGPVSIEFPIPDELQIAQDAPVGTLVGGKEFRGWGNLVPRAAYECMNNPSGGNAVNVDFDAVNTRPIAMLAGGLPRVPLAAPEDSIIETNIPGLGVSIRMANHIDATSESSGQFILQKAEARVPFRSIRHYMHPTIIRIAGHEYFVSLIKTGPIPAGRHTLDPSSEVMHAYLTQPVNGVTTTLHFALSGTLVSAGCSTAADPVSPNPVYLGEFEAKDFEQAGAASQPVRFEFNLENCQPPGGGALPRVHLQLDPTNGSAEIDAADGRFSTGMGSTASGVAFQLLKQDGIQPMPLGTKVPILTMPSGDTKLPLHVRLVKHSGPVTSGALAGALSFTLTYE